jgi:CubicO group peptidase (beta-lactamase class C family)
MTFRTIITAILLTIGTTMSLPADPPLPDSVAGQVESLLADSPGAAVMAIDQGEVILKLGWGKHRVDQAQEQSVACTPQSNFRLASITKQFTATAILLLADRNQLQLDDPISKFFPGAPESWNPINVRDVLTHCSGLRDYEPLIPEGTSLQLSDLNALEILIAEPETSFAPGDEFHYSNSGYVLLGLIVEAVAKKPFHEFVQSEVLDPCGMNASVLLVNGMNEVSNRVFGHRSDEGGAFHVADQSLTSALRGDGGVYSSLDDLQKWIACLQAQSLLSADSYQIMFSPQIKTDRGESHYGMGWFIDEYRGERRIYHNGGTRGFALTLRLFPDRNAAVVVLLNCERDSAKPFDQMADRVTDALLFAP